MHDLYKANFAQQNYLSLFCMFYFYRFSSVNLKSAANVVRSFFPLSKKAPPLEPTTPISAAIPIVSTPPSTSVASSDSLSKRLSAESFFGCSKKTPKSNIPVLTPPSSQ
ncbi:unnamed protein product [Rotaria socialis]|uniref:Uncharacterized protein n=1 Tax=Rotaria socialis TaxID=392032 RepID=A0A821ZFL0_9BILA|nr:unnamed protein product [Rotaria socialis]